MHGSIPARNVFFIKYLLEGFALKKDLEKKWAQPLKKEVGSEPFKNPWTNDSKSCFGVFQVKIPSWDILD